ncbi:DNA-directed RNA polymerase sigma-70 factor [Planotetraspora thailandica]|uniref:DNA-directed RNA polymerase sigma-70 factor n=1 Tax=Planotetraspora thailandica TaxID=487172 RepID=A0A8J3XWV5_9ACTN|nr:sigma-70 family RNA polymerase sigma factor [Planotetraspora thailandica]GII55789.1 DNA-directed RNA polymerase sigma-70 factor [Planotetraspora thailandica]
MPPPDIRPPDDPLAERRRRFEEIYAAGHDPVLGYALRRTANSHDAADVLAETFLTVWRRLDDVPPGEQTRPWLYGVARRVLANHHRGERRRLALGDRLRADLAEALQDVAPAEPHPVTEALNRVSEDDRELLTLTAWEGLDPGQIAVVLGCSRNAVRIRLHRARRRLAREMERHGGAFEMPAPRVAVVKGDNA